jgi:hypothetical protein
MREEHITLGTREQARVRVLNRLLAGERTRAEAGLALGRSVRQVRALVDGLDAETCLAWAHKIAPDAVPDFERWARPERPA